MTGSRIIVVAGVFLAALKLLLLRFHSSLATDILNTTSDAVLALLIAGAAWRASRRSRSYPRFLWLCVGFAAIIWAVNFGTGAFVLMLGTSQSSLSARWPTLVISSFPFAIAFILPLLLSEDREKLEFNWLQALDIAQVGIIVFTVYLVFFYIPSFRGLTEDQRLHYLTSLHLMRDTFLALGYVYREWLSRFPDLRRLHLRMAIFFIGYGLPSLIFEVLTTEPWPKPFVDFIADLPPLFMLVTALTWKQQEDVVRPVESPGDHKGLLWTQALALIVPISVLALASWMPDRYLRLAWLMVTLSFFCYTARLFVMQRQQEVTLSRLVAAEEKFSKAFKSSPIAITLTRLSDGKFIDANDRYLQLMNLTRAQAIGKTSLELGLFENPDEREPMLNALRRNGSVRSINARMRAAGRILDTLISAEVVEFEGEPLIVSSILDMTEFKSVIQQLQQAQKMQLVGSLAGGVAHDFNNLLTIITGYSALAQQKNLDPELAENIGHIKEAAAKAAALTRQLLAFSRRQILQPRNISLNGVVTEIEKLLRRTIGENIVLRTLLAPDLGVVNADPVQMEQVVMNLAVNARDAMPAGGKLHFETSNLDLASPYPQRDFEIPAGRYVMLVITDTGCGIRPEHIDRIFEPFFTTKGVGKGTGLGLSTVYGIVRQSGGYVWAYSHVGTGTTFKICLPRVDAPAEGITLAEKPQDLQGTETVMVVDDDRQVCELTAKILGQYGYHVMTSHSGEEALAQADECASEIDLLVTDVIMGKMSGQELARRLKAKRPHLKLLYVSGYSHFALSENGGGFPDMTLPKPFAPYDLASQARKALRAPELI